MNFVRHSPSSLNQFASAPAMFVLEKILGRRQKAGIAASRGLAVEDGITCGLMDDAASLDACVEAAMLTWRKNTAFSPDPRKEKFESSIPEMVRIGLEELRPYGKPSSTQKWIEWRPEGLKYPIVGKLDYEWEAHGIVLDLKTSDALASKIKGSHAPQVAFYAGALGDNIDARLTYLTPKKVATYQLENQRQHRDRLLNMALACERFLALSDDPAFFVSITLPDTEHFFWSDPAARQEAWQVWKV